MPAITPSRHGLGRLIGSLALATPLAAAGTPAGAKNKRKKCRPSTDVAVVAADGFRGGIVGTAGAVELGQQFVPRRAGRLDRVDVTARSTPSGRFIFEVRDLNQGISMAPVLASAAATIPALARGVERPVTVRFARGARLAAGASYAVVIRRLDDDGEVGSFQPADPGLCFGAGNLLRRDVGEATFTPILGFRPEHTVYVVP